jgi:hypothetical protein
MIRDYHVRFCESLGEKSPGLLDSSLVPFRAHGLPCFILNRKLIFTLLRHSSFHDAANPEHQWKRVL